MAKIYTLPDGRVLSEGHQFVLESRVLSEDDEFVLQEVKYPSNWLELAEAKDLAERGIVVTDAPSNTPLPVQSSQVQVPKSVIVDRLHEAGKLDAARALLDSQDVYTKERWNTRTAINSDDPTTRALLTAIGADPAIILAPVMED